MNKNRNLMLLVLAVVACHSCADQSSKSEADKKGQKTSNAGDATNESQNTITPSPTPNGESTSLTCDEQWNAHIAFFKQGLTLRYNSKLNALAQEIPVLHTEQIIESSAEQVVRTLSLTSTNSVATQIISQIKIPPKLILKKKGFIDVCNQSQKKAQPPIAVNSGTVTVQSVTSESLSTASGTVMSDRFKVQASITLNNKPVVANIDLWGSQKVPGLGLKQVLVIPTVPLVGTATLTSELSTPTAQ